MILVKEYEVQHVSVEPAPLQVDLNAPDGAGGTYSALILCGPDVKWLKLKEGMKVLVQIADMNDAPGE